MRNIVLLLGAMAVAMVSFTPATELPIGSAMPLADTKMKDVSGKEVSLKEATRKNGLLVMFSCNTCPYVKKYQQRTREIAAMALHNEIGVVVVNANAGQRDGEDSFDAMKQYARAQQYNWHYVVDEKNTLADAFGAQRTPENFLFDNKNTLVYHGAIDDNPEAASVSRKYLQSAINEMLEKKEVTVKTTRSVGCGIKRIR